MQIGDLVIYRPNKAYPQRHQDMAGWVGRVVEVGLSAVGIKWVLPIGGKGHFWIHCSDLEPVPLLLHE